MIRQTGVAFRPCPFPVYDDDPARQRVSGLLRLVLVISIFSVLIPIQAGPGASSAVPVFQQRIELETRSPAMIEFDWKIPNLSVSPPSLGFFEIDNQFVFTGEAARGFLYGRDPGGIVVVELEAPLESDLYVDDYLEVIRDKVAVSNSIKNSLLNARTNPPWNAALDPAFEKIWKEIRPDLGADSDFLWPDKVLAGYPDLQGRIEARLGKEARHTALLKELFYQSQEARLELLVAQYDLQLALTRYPHQTVSGMDNFADSTVARDAMLEELQRMSAAWTNRRDSLDRNMGSANRWLQLAESGSRGILSISTEEVVRGVWGNPHKPEQKPNSSFYSPRQRLEISLVQAQIVVENSEIERLDSALARLETMIRHVRHGVAWSFDPPLYTIKRSEMKLLSKGQAEITDNVTGLINAADNKLQVIEFLACRFNEPDVEVNLTEFEQFRTSTYPDEIKLSLVAADIMLSTDRIMKTQSTEAISYNPQLLELLDQVNSFPEDYTPASHHLSFIRFIRWYLDQE